MQAPLHSRLPLPEHMQHVVVVCLHGFYWVLLYFWIGGAASFCRPEVALKAAGGSFLVVRKCCMNG
eukprot:1138443-Pelagomonas_calceolata.AAC.2